MQKSCRRPRTPTCIPSRIAPVAYVHSLLSAPVGESGILPFTDESFDTVLSMNGIHVSPDKEKAWSEMRRVLKTGGSLVACFCIKGESRISDWLMHRILSRKGWFTPPFETFASLKDRLEKDYLLEEYHKEGSMVYLKARKK